MVRQTVNLRSYGDEDAEVQIAVPADTAQALGTVIRFGKRLNSIKVRNVGEKDMDVKVQESAALGALASWSDVNSDTTIVAGGSKVIEFIGLVGEDFVRLFGNATGGSTVARVGLGDVDLLDNFRQTGVYGAG